MFTKIPPHPCLNHLIDYYWIEKNGKSKIKILPDGSTSLVYNLGNSISITNTDGVEYNSKGSVIIGAQKKYIILQTISNSYLVGVKFKQGQAYNFFNVPMHILTNKVTKISEVLSSRENELVNKIELADGKDEIENILNYFFFINAEVEKPEDKIVKSVIDKVRLSNVKFLIKDICKSEKISNKHLITLFNKKVGLSPNLLFRINKFIKVIKLIQQKRDINWSQVAYECNYYDQAHLINEFKNFSGLSPVEYCNNKNAVDIRVEMQ